MSLVRYIGVPRSVVNEAVGEMNGWAEMGDKMLAAAKDACPVGSGDQGGHLRDTLEVKVIGGSDPRLLIGSRTKGAVLSYIHDGTEGHDNVPVNASVLHWTDADGSDVFAMHSYTPAREPRPFILEASRGVLGG